jgi:two-component system NtrC family sensor kinase
MPRGAAECLPPASGEGDRFVRLRIRHKLALSLLLIGGVMLLLVGGALKGLFAYRSTIRGIDGRLAERKAAQTVQERLAETIAATQVAGGPDPNRAELARTIKASRQAITAYEKLLSATLVQQAGTVTGYDERAHLARLRDQLLHLERLARATPPSVISTDSDSRSAWESPELTQIQRALAQSGGELRELIDADLARRIDHSKIDYRETLMLVLGICGVGALLMLTLARLAHHWIVHPILNLQREVEKLAQGDFEGRVDVASADEMEDLAVAFNRMSARLSEIYRDLARQVNDRSKQLIRSERLAGVGYLAAGVAHEINNPLASISFCSEALERRLDELLRHVPDPADADLARSYLQMIQQEAFRCKDITQRLLEFSRVGERPRQMTDLAELVQNVIDMVQHLQAYKGKQIVFSPRQRPHLLINAPEIKSVVLNLIVNALESMEEGGVLTVELGLADGQAVMRFTDTGCGMGPEVLDNLFEPFFTRSRTGKGIGLGLSISHRIVTQHGGEIEAASAGPGQGSTFTVHLPLAPPPAQETPVPAESVRAEPALAEPALAEPALARRAA